MRRERRRCGSFGSHSAGGSRFAERMLAMREGLRAQGWSNLAFLEGAIRAELCGGNLPSPLPI